MFKRILLIWFVANFAIIGIASALLGEWYLSKPPLTALTVELGLIMIPNLVLPVLALRLPAFRSQARPREALGWKWSGARAPLYGITGFIMIYAVNRLIERLFGPSIPYNLPGGSAPLQISGPFHALALLSLLLLFITLTVAAEETMFRGFIQGQVSARSGLWAGLLISALLFGLRHLPADIFYARVWSASASMWVSRESQLYTTAIILGVARLAGRSTYASAITHSLLLIAALFSL